MIKDCPANLVLPLIAEQTAGLAGAFAAAEAKVDEVVDLAGLPKINKNKNHKNYLMKKQNGSNNGTAG